MKMRWRVLDPWYSKMTKLQIAITFDPDIVRRSYLVRNDLEDLVYKFRIIFLML